MDQAEFLNTYINKLTTELTETLKRKVLVETENEVQKKTIESLQLLSLVLPSATLCFPLKFSQVKSFKLSISLMNLFPTSIHLNEPPF